MKERILYMSPPILKSVCEEEMQNANLDTSEVIIEYMTDTHGNKIKKLKPLLIKADADRNYVQHIPSDDDLPAMPESNFIQKREITVDSFSETISPNNESSDDRTATADSNSSVAQSFEDVPCKLETDSKEIKATLNHIASGLQNAAEGYLTLASHMSKVAPYELPQVIAKIPPSPMEVPMPIRKALSIDGENKTTHYLLQCEYEHTNTSWSKIQHKYNVSHNTIYMVFTGKGRLGGSQYQQKRKWSAKKEVTATTSSYKTKHN